LQLSGTSIVMITNNVSIFGLGKLGASMAAGMASRGFNVIGVDVSKHAVDAVNEGRAPVQETGLGEMIADNRQRIRATMSSEEAVTNSEVSFVIVPTPSDELGAFSIKYAAHAFRTIGKALAKKDDYHLVVLTSTVLPGSTRYGLLPVLEAESGKKCGLDFGICYGPEFIALGTVIRDFLNPDFYLIGQFDDHSGEILESVNRRVCLKDPVVRRMSIENAEIAKIALNSYVTLKISFANTIADLCERVPGGDIDIVSEALGSDSRIGRKYLTGGLGFAGPCFPRDNIALSFIGSRLGADCRLLETNDHYNRSLSKRFVEKLRGVMDGANTVAVLGLAYKPLSHIVEDSPGVYLAIAMADAGYRVIGYDPLANESARTLLQYHAIIAENLDQCLQDADVVLVTTQDDIFRNLKPADFLQGRNQVTVIDFWRCLNNAVRTAPEIRYIPIGRCMDDESAADRVSQLWTRGSK
jgi:UDPglucose 6-dehydrogenase